MFSDRFSGIRGQERACKGKIGRENGEGNGNWKGGAGNDGGGAPPPTGRHGRMENGWPSGGQQSGKKLTGTGYFRSTC